MSDLQEPCLTCVAGQELLPDEGHSAGGGGGGVEAAAVGAVGCVCAVRTSVALLAVGAPVQAPALVGCREEEKKIPVSGWRSEGEIRTMAKQDSEGDCLFCRHSFITSH